LTAITAPRITRVMVVQRNIAITAATGYFVAQEFGYMAVDRSTLNARAAAGDAAAKRA
jgi:CBS domain containing-hemolysin-like protein